MQILRGRVETVQIQGRPVKSRQAKTQTNMQRRKVIEALMAESNCTRSHALQNIIFLMVVNGM